LRDQMLAELNIIGSEDEAAKWVHRRLPDKNKLNAMDAKHIEEIFRVKLKAFALHHAEGLSPSEHGSEAAPAVEPVEPGTETDAPEPKRKPRGKSVDKSVLSHPEPRRIRDREHVRFVAQQACLICGRKPSDAHHLRFAQSRALGARSATNSPCRSAVGIIASFIAMAMKPNGGVGPVSIPMPQPGRYGSKCIRSRMRRTSDNLVTEVSHRARQLRTSWARNRHNIRGDHSLAMHRRRSYNL
ncbi:MAG: hypothetical protein WB806_09380, partial [Xanthobacteraceae bacterium]